MFRLRPGRRLDDRPTAAPRHTRRDERGASAVEYGLLLAGVVLVLVGMIPAFSTVVRNVFLETCDGVAQHSNTVPTKDRSSCG